MILLFKMGVALHPLSVPTETGRYRDSRRTEVTKPRQDRRPSNLHFKFKRYLLYIRVRTHPDAAGLTNRTTNTTVYRLQCSVFHTRVERKSHTNNARTTHTVRYHRKNHQHLYTETLVKWSCALTRPSCRAKDSQAPV